MFTCGFVRSNFSFAIARETSLILCFYFRTSAIRMRAARPIPAPRPSPRTNYDGAHDQTRTDDPLLTMEVLYQLSYAG